MSNNNSPYLSVSEVADRIGGDVKPRDISDLFYQRRLRTDICPLIGNRRAIPEDYVPLIAAELQRAGHTVGRPESENV